MVVNLPSAGDIIPSHRILLDPAAWEGPKPVGPMVLVQIIGESARNLGRRGETWIASQIEGGQYNPTGPVQILLDVQPDESDDLCRHCGARYSGRCKCLSFE